MGIISFLAMICAFQISIIKKKAGKRINSFLISYLLKVLARVFAPILIKRFTNKTFSMPWTCASSPS